MKIGPYQLKNNLVLAPMAGISDKPFRQVCRKLGAGLAVSEMITTNPALYNTKKTKLRLDHNAEESPVVVQIAGADPEMMAAAASYNVNRGADIIDINMGCPAKKVCKKLAGSALLRDEDLVEKILRAVTKAVKVPVTLKIRTGWDNEHKNAVKIATISEQCGIQALTVHGRTRADGFSGQAEFDTVADIKSRISIPVIANGDITSARQAAYILQHTGVDALMIGRAARGYPWIFNEISFFLEHGYLPVKPTREQTGRVLSSHLRKIYDYYGEYSGIRIARKHIAWYSQRFPEWTHFKQVVNKLTDCKQQFFRVLDFYGIHSAQDLAA